MQFTTHEIWTLVHGIGFGALYLLLGSGAIISLRKDTVSQAGDMAAGIQRNGQAIYLTGMALLAWLTVLTGTYLVYPWYRAPAPPNTPNLTEYPRSLLLSNPATATWHTVGMEYKEHVGWLVPFAITMAAVIAWRYGSQLRQLSQIRRSLQFFVAGSLVAAAFAGLFGALIDKAAPVSGGKQFQLLTRGKQ